MDVVQVVADRLSKLITQRGYSTVESFAYENGLDKSALSKILKGRRRPRFDTLIRIAEALGVTLNDLYLAENASLVREAWPDSRYGRGSQAKPPKRRRAGKS